MKNVSKFNKGLSIQELEERHELTVAFGDDSLEADKIRCNDNVATLDADLIPEVENPE